MLCVRPDRAAPGHHQRLSVITAGDDTSKAARSAPTFQISWEGWLITRTSKVGRASGAPDRFTRGVHNEKKKITRNGIPSKFFFVISRWGNIEINICHAKKIITQAGAFSPYLILFLYHNVGTNNKFNPNYYFIALSISSESNLCQQNLKKACVYRCTFNTHP